jgi:hypothetical protein
MALRLIVLTFVSVAAFAQQSKSGMLTGTIAGTVGNEIGIETGKQTSTVYTNETTKVYADDGTQIFGPINLLAASTLPLKAGNQIRVRCSQDPSGKLRAVSLWFRPEAVTIRATVTKVNSTSFEVQADRDGSKVVFFYQNTAFSTSRKHLSVDQDVQVVGFDLGSRNVVASRVTIYNTDLPVFMDFRFRPPR